MLGFLLPKEIKRALFSMFSMAHPIAKRFKGNSSTVIKLPLSPKYKYFNIPEGASFKPPGAPQNVKILNKRGKLFNLIIRKSAK